MAGSKQGLITENIKNEIVNFHGTSLTSKCPISPILLPLTFLQASFGNNFEEQLVFLKILAG